MKIWTQRRPIDTVEKHLQLGISVPLLGVNAKTVHALAWGCGRPTARAFIAKRIALDAAPLPWSKTSVKVFDLADLACPQMATCC
jgi:hypothetical protein